MGDLKFETTQHLGHKISGVRRLVGISQKDLADRLGVTKQAVSKLEQTEKISDERLSQIAEVLGVTSEGLKKFNNENVTYYTNNFYENSNAKIESSQNGHVDTLNHFSIDQAVKLFEELLKIEREKYDQIKDTKQ